jgi:hypothetical protein
MAREQQVGLKSQTRSVQHLTYEADPAGVMIHGGNAYISSVLCPHSEDHGGEACSEIADEQRMIIGEEIKELQDCLHAISLDSDADRARSKVISYLFVIALQELC